MKSKSIGSSELLFESMIFNSATEDAIDASPELSAARKRISSSTPENWEQRLERALDASTGKSLLLLSHISEGKVVVEDLGGQPVFQIEISELSQLAASKNVELILIGCDTASYIEDNSLPFGVIGRHDSQAMAQRLASILPHASSLGDLADKLSSPDLKVVVYDKDGGYGYEGASGFARLVKKDQWVRVFRILSLKFTGRS
ncbi:hypothetical protein ACQ86G_17235 [Roseateles chitinivorans]|uniref:hypothetical protein n=1 Tax=Roseateles chitinivorans TaxID=2917965 RepID=UPI003D67FE0D